MEENEKKAKTDSDTAGGNPTRGEFPLPSVSGQPNARKAADISPESQRLRKNPKEDAGAPEGDANVQKGNAETSEPGICGEENTESAGTFDGAEALRYKSKNLRIACSCICFVVLAAAVSLSFMFYRGCSSVDKTVDKATNALGGAISTAADALTAYLKQNPKSDVSYGAEYVGAKSENKYVVACVDEKVSVRGEFSKFKIMSGSVKLEATAHYQYYIPLRGIKFRVKKSPNDGKLYFSFYFDSLKCDLPVKYSEITRDIRQSAVSNDVNREIEEYQKKFFPEYLADRAGSAQNMLSARIEAELAMKKYLLENIFPFSGISLESVGGIETIFDTGKFDAFKTGILQNSETD